MKKDVNGLIISEGREKSIPRQPLIKNDNEKTSIRRNENDNEKQV